MWWQIGIFIFNLLWHVTATACTGTASNFVTMLPPTPDLPPDAKGHRTGPVTDVSIQSCRHAAAAVHHLQHPHHPHHMADKVRPLETRTGRLHQGRKTAPLGNWTLHIYTLQQHCSPAFLLANCSKYLEIYGKLFIAWLLLRPNICLMAVTIFLSRYSLLHPASCALSRENNKISTWSSC